MANTPSLDTSHPLSDSVLKLARAEQHLDALHSQIAWFAQHVDQFVVGQRDSEADRRQIVIATSAAIVFKNWGLVAGDFIHNVRSALDVAVSAISRGHGRSDRRSGFPLVGHQTDETRRSMKSLTRGLSPEQQAIVYGLQPYEGGNGPRLLNSLRSLSNDDKHRVLHPARGLVRSLRLQPVNLPEGVVIKDFRVAERVTLEPGALIASFATNAAGGVEVKMKYDLTFEVAFAEAGGYFALMSVGDFMALHRHAISVIERLALTLEVYEG